MMTKPLRVLCAVCCGALVGCERPDTSASDAALTSANATLNATAIPPTVGEQVVLEPNDAGAVAAAPTSGAADAGAGTATLTSTTLPRWVPKDAALTIISSADRDRNLGIAPPPSPERAVAIDAGSCEIGIQLRPRP
jgi:hypothetical protein